MFQTLKFVRLVILNIHISQKSMYLDFLGQVKLLDQGSQDPVLKLNLWRQNLMVFDQLTWANFAPKLFHSNIRFS